MFDHNTLAEIFSHLSAQDLYNTTKVNHLWQKVSQNQLKIDHQTNPILPILHNRLIKDQFIQSLRDIFLDYIQEKSITFKKFLLDMNDLHDYGYDNDKFILMFNKANKSAYTKLIFDALYDYVMKTIKHDIYDYSNIPKPSHEMSYLYRKSPVFEKAFVIFMYLRKILTKVYDQIYFDEDEYEYINWHTDIDHNKVFYYDLPSTRM